MPVPLPSSIVLSRPEAFGVLAAIDGAAEVLRDTPWLGVLLDLEDAAADLVGKLYPEEEP